LNNGVGSFDAIGYTAWWNLPALPKFNTQTPAVREFIFEAAEYWLRFGADGWRLDVPAEINDDSFWQEFRRRVKAVNPDAYIVGELWLESQRWLKGDQFDAVMNYLVSAALMGWLIGDKMPEFAYRIGGLQKVMRPFNAAEFGDRIEYLLNLYDPEINYAQLNLLDSHDTPRFITTAGGDETALRLAYLFLFTFIGAPCIYYGDEVGLDGGPDPECRKSFPWDESRWNQELHDYMKDLIHLRNAHPALRRGSYKRIFSDNEMLAFTRQYMGKIYLVVINAGLKERQLHLDLTQTGVSSRAVESLFGLGRATLEGSSLRIEQLPSRQGVVLKLE
jgi:neopullulanase